jgi:RNA polymerase sigma factor (sigma-70 family)
MLLEMTSSDLDLLRQYAGENSQDAFAAVVRRHLDLVYSAALRQVRSPQLAEEVVQSVFTDLARYAHRLAPDTILSAWLYQVTRRTAIDAIRREARRHLHEQTAAEMNALNATASDWAHIEPLLDEAMHALDETDRTAVLLRFFENKSLRDVGQSLGTSEDAAQKRVSRAVERLREFFARRGVTVGASGLVVGISAHAVQAAPAGLFATVTTAAAFAGTTLVTATATTAAKAIAMTTLQKTLVTVLLAAAVGAGIYQAHQASNLRDQVQVLQQQQALLDEQNAQLRSDNERLSNRVAQADSSLVLRGERLRELLKLRSEVATLRRQQRELERAAAAAQSNPPGQTGQPALAATPQPAKPPPFQVQLVLYQAGENTEPLTNNTGGETLYVQKKPLLDHTAISSVTVEKNPLGAPVISVEFSDVGKELFAQITKENLNKRLAIVLNGQLYSAPVIRSEISGGKAQISGSFSEAEAGELAANLSEAISAK